MIGTIAVALFLLFDKLTVCQSIYEGPAPIDYFKQSLNVSSIDQLPELRCWDEWRDWNGGKNYNTHFGKTNVSDISFSFFGETNISYPVQFYTMTITSQMKTKYKSTLHVSTACGLSELCLSPIFSKYFWNISMEECGIYVSARSWERYHAEPPYSNDRISHYNEYCNLTTLDTVMYILHEKKGRVTLIESKDDCVSSDHCIIPTKSVIDLTNYQEGRYIIGIGGFGTEYGKFELQLVCEQMSFPITNEEIDPSSAILGELTCGTTLHNQSWTDDNTVVYYALNVTHLTYFPFRITVCVDEDYSFDAYIIELGKLGLHYDVLIKMDHTSYLNRNESSMCFHHHESYGMPAIITIHENINNIFVGNLYWVMLQPFINHAMGFAIHMECSDAPTPLPTNEPSVIPTETPSNTPTKSPTVPPKIPEELVTALVFGLCGLLILIFVVYYLYKWKQYLDAEPSKRSHSGISSPSYARSPKGEKLLQHDEDDESDEGSHDRHASEKAIELARTAPLTHDDEEEVKSPKDLHLSCSSLRAKLGSAQSLVAIRSLHRNKSVGEQLHENEDVVQLILADAIQSCIDQSGFDVYQVLALRYYDVLSQNVIPRRPFRSIGIDIEFIELSPFVSTVLSATVVGLTQTFGISMVVYKLFMGYFADDDIFDKICSMEQQRWSDVFSLKVLAFLLSLVITLFVGGLINGVRHDGLYEILSKLSLQHIERVPRIAIWILQLGQAINYYVCFWAVIGSYFIIFVSNTGELQEDGWVDYSGAGIEMILNAVALFFMLELDDMLVTDDDYSDCEQHLKDVLSQYVPDTTINTRYTHPSENTTSANKGRVDSNIQSTFGKYEKCAITTMYHLINMFSVFVTVCCYVSGFIAPFVIFFCW